MFLRAVVIGDVVKGKNVDAFGPKLAIIGLCIIGEKGSCNVDGVVTVGAAVGDLGAVGDRTPFESRR